MGILNNFLHEYRANIEPKLSEIDVFLKTSEYPLDIQEVADILCMEIDDICNIMDENNIEQIYLSDFLGIMRDGKSWICRLYRRELEIGSPYVYNPMQIAYIYNLDSDAVEDACKKLKIKEVTSYMMPMLFREIELY